MRSQKLQGEFKRLNEYKYPQILEEELHSFYKFSGEMGTVNFAHSRSVVSGKDDNLFKSNFLAKHGIEEHLIIMSLQELTNHNYFIKWFSKPGDFFQLFDPRVMVINNIMYTFHREGIYVVENNTRENWYWGPNNFQKVNPLLKYDYQDQYMIMVQDFIVTKVFKFLWLTFVFSMISIVNALFIRVSIKCSVLMIFPMISCQNRISENSVSTFQRRLIY